MRSKHAPADKLKGRAAIVTCLKILAERGRQVREQRETKPAREIVYMVAEEKEPVKM